MLPFRTVEQKSQKTSSHKCTQDLLFYTKMKMKKSKMTSTSKLYSPFHLIPILKVDMPVIFALIRTEVVVGEMPITTAQVTIMIKASDTRQLR